MSNPNNASEQKSAARQLQEQALGHAAALGELDKEFPKDKRTPEDEKYLQQLLTEGRGLREDARDARPTAYVSRNGEVVTPYDEAADFVANQQQGHAHQH